MFYGGYGFAQQDLRLPTLAYMSICHSRLAVSVLTPSWNHHSNLTCKAVSWDWLIGRAMTGNNKCHGRHGCWQSRSPTFSYFFAKHNTSCFTLWNRAPHSTSTVADGWHSSRCTHCYSFSHSSTFLPAHILLFCLLALFSIWFLGVVPRLLVVPVSHLHVATRFRASFWTHCVDGKFCFGLHSWIWVSDEASPEPLCH